MRNFAPFLAILIDLALGFVLSSFLYGCSTIEATPAYQRWSLVCVKDLGAELQWSMDLTTRHCWWMATPIFEPGCE